MLKKCVECMYIDTCVHTLMGFVAVSVCVSCALLSGGSCLSLQCLCLFGWPGETACTGGVQGRDERYVALSWRATADGRWWRCGGWRVRVIHALQHTQWCGSCQEQEVSPCASNLPTYVGMGHVTCDTEWWVLGVTVHCVLPWRASKVAEQATSEEWAALSLHQVPTCT